MFSKTTEYALRATIYIAQKSSADKKLAIGEIAKAIDSPPSFTAKILQLLTAENRIISSVRGPNGGFYITEKAKSLPVRAILEALGNDEVFSKCVLGLKLCSEVNPCPMHTQYKKIKQQITDLFESKTIQSLANEIKSGDAVITNVPYKRKAKKSIK
jgi:Rrf2 family transcriptional regulator, iron-sulfur cluster assembly transcription factor